MDGDGVRARGESGMWPQDLRRGDRNVCTNLCFRPCSVDGLWKWPVALKFDGELGSEEVGEEDCEESEVSEWW